jgi:hypothetical protein
VEIVKTCHIKVKVGKIMLGFMLVIMLSSNYAIGDAQSDREDEIRRKALEEAERQIAAEREAARLERIRIAAIPVEEDLSIDGWGTEYTTFNYKQPCDTDDTPFVAIILNGVNRKDRLTERKGELVHFKDVSIAFDRIFDFCGAIVRPKSGLSTVVENGVEVKLRTWWMTQGTKDDNGIPVRLLADEVNAVIDIATQFLHKPVYLVLGNDYGVLTIEVLNELRDRGKIRTIGGILYVDRDTGEFTKYNVYGTIWDSEGKLKR